MGKSSIKKAKVGVQNLKSTKASTSTKKSTVATRKSKRSRNPVNYTSERVLGENDLKSRSKKSSTPVHSLIGKSSIYKNPPVRPPSNLRVHAQKKSEPTRNRKTGDIVFPDHPEFRPNLTPKEVLQLGSFGGTYFRPIKSGVTGLKYSGVWKEFPKEWFEGLDMKRQVISSTYDVTVNKYAVKCGGDLDMWESSGWITALDPYGWFQWYCRFYLGRRTEDDDRQISRANGVIGPKGRFRVQLMNKIARAGKNYDDFSISPVIRQTLQHWGYCLTQKDLKVHCKRKGL